MSIREVFRAKVVTKDMLDFGEHDETTWAALDFMTAEGAGMWPGEWENH